MSNIKIYFQYACTWEEYLLYTAGVNATNNATDDTIASTGNLLHHFFHFR